MMVRLEGVFSVLPTPFTSGGQVDRTGLERAVDLCVHAGVDGLTALGVTGEVARLDDTERAIVLETVLEKVNGRVPVVAGTTAGGAATCIQYSKAAQAAGAAAVMVSPPRMAKLNSDSVFRHYQALAVAMDLPIVVQDYPPVCGFSMEPSLLLRIAREIPLARTIKMEDPPTPLKTARLMQEAKDLQLNIFGGLGGTYLLEELMAGATGAMTGFAYPEILVEIVRTFRAGNVEGAADIFYRYVPLMRFEFQEGIGMAIRKEVYRRRGAFANSAIRPPGTPLDEGTSSALDMLLNWIRRKENPPWI